MLTYEKLQVKNTLKSRYLNLFCFTLKYLILIVIFLTTTNFRQLVVIDKQSVNFKPVQIAL